MKRLVAAIASLVVATSVAFAWTHGIVFIPSSNGGLSQINLSINGINGQYPFVNFLLDNENWTWQDPTDLVGSTNGWPGPSALMNVGPGGWQTQILNVPNGTEYSGTWTLDWSGGSITVNVANSSGSDNPNGTPFGNATVVGGVGCTASGTAVTGTNCSATYPGPSASGNTVSVYFKGYNGSSPINYIRLYRTSDASRMATCQSGITNSNVSQLQSCFTQEFLSALSNFGVIRFMNSMNANGSNVATWSDVKPVNWSCWSCNNDYYKPSAWVPRTTATVANPATNLYTLAFPGFTLVDKEQVQAGLATTSTTITPPTTTAASTTSGSSNTLVVASTTGLVTGMMLIDNAFINNNNPIAYGTTITNINTGTNTLTLSNNIGTVTSGQTITFSPMININSTGYIPMVRGDGTVCANTTSSSCSIVWNQGDYGLLTYDQALGANGSFHVNSVSHNSGALNGEWPPLVAIALANAVNAHPWFTMPPYAMTSAAAGVWGGGMTDYFSNLATLVKNNLRLGLVPRYEGPNETWNYVFQQTTYADYFLWMASNRSQGFFQHDQWYGWVMSLMGAELNSLYHGGKGLRWWLVAGMSAGDDQGIPVTGCSNNPGTICQDSKLSSGWWVAQGGTAASTYVSHIAPAGYWNNGWGNVFATQWGWCYANQGSCSISQATLLANYSSTVNGGPRRDGPLWIQNNRSQFATYAASYAGLGYTEYEGAGNDYLGPSIGSDLTYSVSSVTTGTTTVLGIGPVGLKGYITTGSAYGSTGFSTLNITTNPTAGAIMNDAPLNCGGCAAGTAIGTSNNVVTPQQTVGSSGSPVSFTQDNPWDYIYNTNTLCSSCTTTKIAGVCAALNGNTYTILSATATSITINANTTGGCTYGGFNGTASAVGSGTYIATLEKGAFFDTVNYTALALSILQNAHSTGIVFPSMYDLADAADNQQWGKYNPDIFSPTAQISAVQQFNANP